MSEISAASIIHRTDEKEYITGYWQKRSTGFANLRKAELHSEKQLLWQQEITRHLPQNRRLKILDIGCGAGFFGILLGQKHSVTGIDLTPEMIEAARALAAAERSNAEFMVMDAEALDFADASFDAIISRNVMWNLPHPEKAYREWLRVLKPGGLLLNYDAEYARAHHSQKLPAKNCLPKTPMLILRRSFWTNATTFTICLTSAPITARSGMKNFCKARVFAASARIPR